jgi:hypothetical protein
MLTAGQEKLPRTLTRSSSSSEALPLQPSTMLISERRDLVMADYIVLVAVAVVGFLIWAITAQLKKASTQRIMNEIDLQKDIIG